MTIPKQATIPVSKRIILGFAGVLWIIGGFNIIRLGLPDMVHSWHIPVVSLIGALVVFGLFFFLIFVPLYKKHRKRIITHGEAKNSIFTAFDIKGYAIMFFMITLGIVIRSLHIVPPLYLGPFYTGLGSALEIAGILFILSALFFTVAERRVVSEIEKEVAKTQVESN